MNKQIKIFLIIIAILFVASLVYVLSIGSGSSIKNGAKIILTEKSFDFGQISMAQGLVTHGFEVKNEGTEDLILSDIKTSCMCTTVVINDGVIDSPKFGMHNNPIGWTQKIKAGGKVMLKATFDPNAHGPNATGVISRDISFLTNDTSSENQKITLKIYGEVVK
jgi:hypothetical protein